MNVKDMLSPNVAEMLNKAIQSELYAANLYKHLSNQLQRIGLLGAATYFRKESADELEHYQALADYFNDRGCVAQIPGIPPMTEQIASLRDAIETAYATEVQLGDDYAKWYSLASADIATQQFLLKYIEIQRKSIGEYGDLLARLSIADNDPSAILLVDREMGDL
jgi:ferritin